VGKITASIAPARGWHLNPSRVVLWLGSTLIALMFAVANASPAAVHGQIASVSKATAPVPPVRQWDSTPSVVTSEYEYHEPTNQSRNQQFGVQVALSGDGRTMAVADVWYFGGSEWPWYGSGAVYVYRLTSGGWTLEAKLEPPGARGYDFFGSDVALSKSGDTLVIGAQNEGYDAPSQDAGPGSVFVYSRRDGTWTEETMLRASRPQDNVLFGRAVEVSASGDVIAVGAPYESIEMDGVMQSGAGAVYIFTKQADVWVEQQAVSAPDPQRYDLFGWGVRLSENGGTLAILAAEQNYLTEDPETGGWPNRNNTVYVFEARSGSWNLAVELEGSANDPHLGGAAYESEGQSEGFDLSADGRTLAIASPFTGAADGGAGVIRIYRRGGQHWKAASTTLTPTLSDRRSFGLRLTLSANGRTLVAFADRDDGAYGQPYVIAFDYQHHQWQQSAIFETPGPQISSGFANSLALSWSGRRLAVGARTFSTENTWWGAVLVYGRRTSVNKP
jgi:hypothetical protein